MMTNYPQSVEHFADKMTEAVQDLLGDEIGIEEYRARCLEKCFEKFLSGESLISVLEGNDYEEILKLAAYDTVINSLKEKGLVDSIEDETGKTINFLTANGKLVNSMLNSQNS